jgi:alkylation response protein AidB-like acyl-CoA dehydrogenase
MNFAFSEEQEFLRETARRFLEEKCSTEIVRQAMIATEGFDESQWSELATMGWQAMAIPEEYGGAGFSFLELFVLMEEMGRALMPGPFLSSVILAANVVLYSGSEEQKQSLLPTIASGEMTATLAFTEPSGKWDESGIFATASREEDEWVISGTKSFVLDGHTADTLLVVVRTDAGISILHVPSSTGGITATLQDTMDQTRKMAEIRFDGVRVPRSALIGRDGAGWATIEYVLRLGAVALAAEQVGGAQKVLEMAVSYAKVRTQFGRPIGSFQAIKHKCVDMLVGIESAKSAAYYAGWAASEGNDELPIVAPLAKSYCSEVYFSAAAENIQIHGGIGFTWEHDAHLYFKRAKSSELLFGDAVHHRAMLADAIGI